MGFWFLVVFLLLFFALFFFLFFRHLSWRQSRHLQQTHSTKIYHPWAGGWCDFPTLESLHVGGATEAFSLDGSRLSAKALPHSISPNRCRTHHQCSRAEEVTDWLTQVRYRASVGRKSCSRLWQNAGGLTDYCPSLLIRRPSHKHTHTNKHAHTAYWGLVLCMESQQQA